MTTVERVAPVLIGNPPVGSTAWHDARRVTINGSEIAAVMGISPYESPFSLWHRKAGSLADVAQSDEMYWGTQLEDVIRAEFTRRHADEFMTLAGCGLYRHRDRTWQGGSPDGQIVEAPYRAYDGTNPAALLECKTARYDDGWGDEGTDEIPVHYRAQCLWYLDVFGLTTCHVAVLIAGSEYREYRIDYDADELDGMRTAARAFLDSLDDGTAPALDGHEATYSAVRELHPDIDPTTVTVTADVAVPYLQAIAAHKDAEHEKRRTAALLADAMGNAKDAYHAGQHIASRQAKNTPGSTPYVVAKRGAADTYRKDTAA